MSIAGGLHHAIDHIEKVKGTALQIFTKNQRQWFTPPLSGNDIELFKKRRNQWGPYPVASHDSYLINLASPKEDIGKKSVAAFADEIVRADLLDIPYLVMHPGSHLGSGIEVGLQRFVANLDLAIKKAGDKTKTMVLIETTAGQGSGIGARFEELAYILNESKFPDKLGVCLDTCHIYAAGYDIKTPAGYAHTMTEFDRIVGLKNLLFFHLNDSKKDLGGKVDRHEHIGRGAIGLEGFRNLINDPRFAAHPMVLETPKGKDLLEDIENLKILKNLIT